MGKKFKNKDIALRLGVSGTLVSLVLNNKADQQGIKKDTQEKVLTMAKKMGFFDNVYDRKEVMPIEEKPGIICMIITPANDTFIHQITPYLQKAFSSIGIGFSIIIKDNDDQRYFRMLSSFKRFYSGLILYGESADDETLRILRSNEYPFVILEKQIKSLRLNMVASDSLAGANIAVNYIEKLGYKNILIITDKNSSQYNSVSINDLFDSIKNKQNINRPVLIEIDDPSDRNDIEFQKIESLLRPPFRADVIITMNANIVYNLMPYLRRKKIRIPQDIALLSMEEGIGFDSLLTPVTSIRKQLSGISIKVANILWSEIKNAGKGKFKRQVNIAPELVIRDSCGSM
jgi:DNA-binding LacI/PurR family transcriptional regulator